mgnify:CR=1 FL=1
MKNRLLYLFFKVFIGITKILPYRACAGLGKGIGSLLYRLLKSRNRMVRTNIAKAFPGKFSTEEIEQIIKDMYHNLGMTFVEFMLLERLSKEEIASCITVEGEEYLVEMAKKDKGVILYSAHFGNWEWQAIYFAVQGCPVTAIAKDQKNPYFNRRINEIRSSKGVEIIPSQRSLKNVYKRLEEGNFLYILGDQNAGKRGWQMKFFWRKASTYSGPVRLAARTESYILPVFMVREGWMKHRILVYPPYQIDRDATKEEQEELLQELTSLTEKVISTYPEQWFWLHRRWKR